MSKTWSWSTGERGVNRVRVYERKPGGPLQIEWHTDGGRKRKSLKKLVGEPVYDRETAKTIATEMAAKLRSKSGPKTNLLQALGLGTGRTLKEAWDQYIATRNSRWAESYHTDQRRYRAFWCEALGADTRLTEIAPATVERSVNEAAEERDWSDNTVRHYLVVLKSVLNFAARDLRWMPESALPAIDFPDIDPEGHPYEPRELAALLEETLQLDLRLGVMARIGCTTLRRLGAIRELELKDLASREIDGDVVPVIRFPGDTDKQGKTSEAVLPPSTAKLVKRLAEKPAVRAAGYLFVRGDLEDPDPPEDKRKPLHDRTVNEWWHEAEAAAGVEWIDGRAFHGIKRIGATVSSHLTGGLAAAAQQSGTDADTLREVYVKSYPEQKRDLAERLEAFFAEQSQDG